jgi:exodeoxyribonuclease VII small subunit
MPKKSSPALPAVALLPLPARYEDALEELENLVNGLESGQLPLDQLLCSYQRGAQLLQFCQERLAAVQNQIKVLEGTELQAWSAE